MGDAFKAEELTEQVYPDPLIRFEEWDCHWQ
jgi:hypothetical protein